MGNEARQNPRAREYRGPGVVLDARARALQPGDEVILAGSGPFYFRIVEITPLLDPKLPPGMMHVAFGAVMHFSAQRGVVNPEFVRVRTAEEAGPLPLSPMAGEAEGEPPSGNAQPPDLQIVKPAE